MPLLPIGTDQPTPDAKSSEHEGKLPFGSQLVPKPPEGARPPTERSSRNRRVVKPPENLVPETIPPPHMPVMGGARSKVDILEPPKRAIPKLAILPSRPPLKVAEVEELYRGAFEMPGASPAPEDPSRYEREFEEDVDSYLVKFERACSNMSIALEGYRDTMNEVQYKHNMKLHPDEYSDMCEYMVDLCPAALEIMSSIADYGRGLASRYSKKYPDYWKNPKYEKLLIRGHTAQTKILETLKPNLSMSLPTSNKYSGHTRSAYDKLEAQLALIEGVKSDIPENGGNFHLGMTESNIENIMSGIRDKHTLLSYSIEAYIIHTTKLDNHTTPMAVPEVKYTRYEARRDLEKNGGAEKIPNQKIIEELEAIQRALKEVKWYNYRLEPHKRGKQYKIVSDSLNTRSDESQDLLKKAADKMHGGDLEKVFQEMADTSNEKTHSGFTIPLVAAGHFEAEFKNKFNRDRKKMLENSEGAYLVLGEIRDFRVVRGDGGVSSDSTNINYQTGSYTITPKTFRGTTTTANNNVPCLLALVAVVHVYPKYKYVIDVMNLFQCSAHYKVSSRCSITNLAICDQGKRNVDVIYDVEDFFKADDKHIARKEEYERDVAEALRDERAGNKNAKTDKVLKDANRMLNNLGYFKEAASKPKWAERLEDITRFPSGIGAKGFEKLNLATLMVANQYYSIGHNEINLVKEAFDHIEKMANRYYWYLPKLGDPEYIGDTKESLEEKTKDLLEKLKIVIESM